MRCEVVVVGTELLLGQIVDTNSAWIGEQLALAGMDCFYQSKVGDNLGRIVQALQLALSRAEVVICCGGLGPTHDDLTRDAIAQLMGVALQRDEQIVERIRERFRLRHRVMSENNLRQAEVPVGASILSAMPGTAPGLRCPIGDKLIFAVPGVPYEMKEMLSQSILPELCQRAGLSATIRSRTLRTWGHAESTLAEMLEGYIQELDQRGNPTLAFLASGIEGIKIRLTAKADTPEQTQALLAAEEARVRAIVGECVFGVDDESMEFTVLRRLRERGLSLGLAESLTGGLVGARLTAVPGASEVLRGGLLAYQPPVKQHYLGVEPGPVIGLEAAKQMALGARQLLGSDVGLATTGVAGPSESEGQAVGTVYLGLSIGDYTDARLIKLPGNREQIRQFTVISLLDWLRRTLD